MARSIDKIQEEIVQDINNDVPELTNPSQLSLWRKMARIVASAINKFEVVLDFFKADVERVIDDNRIGSTSWYAFRAKEFQFSSAPTGQFQLLVDPNTGQVKYDVVNEAARIVAQASAEVLRKEGTEEMPIREILILKAAKLSGSSLAKLEEEEIRQFRNYISEIKPPGVPVGVSSGDPDELKFTATLYVSGNVNSEVVKSEVVDAINEYANAFEFDGLIYRNDVEQIIRDVTGVRDAVFSDLTLTPSDTSIPAFQVTDRERIPAGYFVFSEQNSTIDIEVA